MLFPIRSDVLEQAHADTQGVMWDDEFYREMPSMGAEPSLDEIMAAIEESGYFMEQHVATQLERLGFQVTTNFAVEDPDEGKSREMDVRAVKRVAVAEQEKIAAFVELIVECKNTSNPFVFIARPKNERDLRAVLGNAYFLTHTR